MSKEALSFFKNLQNGITSGINSIKIGKVVKLKPETMMIDVLPLPSEDNAIILNVPISTIQTKDFLVYYPLQVDDLVVLAFSDNDTDNILQGEDSVATERRHDVTDCICLGSIITLKDNIPLEDKENLVIQNKENTASVVIKKDGDIIIKAKNFKVEADRIDLN